MGGGSTEPYLMEAKVGWVGLAGGSTEPYLIEAKVGWVGWRLHRALPEGG